MANLGQKSTDGRLSFVKYVTQNPRFKEIEYEIEKGSKTFVFSKKGQQLVAGSKEFKEGTKIKITDKDFTEFGKIKFAAVKIGAVSGFIPISMIRKPTGGNGTQYEDQVVDAFNAYILEAGGTIDIKLKGDSKIYKKISYAIKVDSDLKRKAGVKGDPKADIILCVDKKDPLAKTSIFISHKKEGGPEAFQQYGGLSEQAGKEINNHKLVQKFLKIVGGLIEAGDGKLQSAVMGEFKDDTLANMSIYGPDYGKPFSIQHTQLIGQGNPKFSQKGNAVEVDFTFHMSLSGDLSHFSGGYTPVFGATYREGRGFNVETKKYVGARVGIYPIKLIQGRSGVTKVKL